MPCLMSAAEDLQRTISHHFQLQLNLLVMDVVQFLHLKEFFFHFLSSHFISQRGDHSTVVSRVHLVRFSGIQKYF